MNSEEIDIDLEAKLYSQVHHEYENVTNTNPDTFTPARIVTNKSVVNLSQSNATTGNIPSNRYFMGGNRALSLTESGFYKPMKTFLKPSSKGKSRETTSSEIRTKVFTPYTPYLNNNILNQEKVKNNVLPKINKPNKSAKIIANKNISTKEKETTKIKNVKETNALNKTKQNKVNKYIDKKQKADEIRNRKREKEIPTIILDESDDNDDDVVEIPVTPPPTVFIESSDESIISTRSEFLPPKKSPSIKNKHIKQQQLTNIQNSRCSSPSNSIISDDFIIANDRNRLNSSRDLSQLIDDDEINDNQPTVDSIVRKNLELNKKSNNHIETNKNQIISTEDDTYSELSDISFSKHIAGMKNQLNNKSSTESISSVEHIIVEPKKIHKTTGQVDSLITKNKNNDQTHNKSDDQNGIYERHETLKQKKIKKLRKRKTSGSNKGSEYNSLSSDDDDNLNAIDSKQPELTKKKKKIKKRKLENNKNSEQINPSDDDANDDNHHLIDNEENKKEKGQNKRQEKNERKRFDSVNPSDEDFFSILRDIVNGEPNIINHNVEEKEKSDNETLVEDMTIEGNEDEDEDDESQEEEEEDNESLNEEEEEDNESQEEEEDQSQEEELDNDSEKDEIDTEQQETFTDLDLMNIVNIEENSSSSVNIDLKTLTQPDEKDKHEIKDDNIVDNKIMDVKGVKPMFDNPEDNWNNEMKYFYNESWGGDYNVNKLKSVMNANRANWLIFNEERKRKRIQNIRCANCNEMGHSKKKCLLPIKKISCYMCGGSHRATRCPNKICLTCGASNHIFSFGCDNCHSHKKIKCNLCNVFGHIYTNCPDKWRRYHSTIQDNEPLVTKVIQNPKKYCSICAGGGHYADNCRNALRILDQPAFKSKIQNYEQIYPKISNLNNNNVSETNQIDKKRIDFLWNNQVKLDDSGFYGRFLKNYRSSMKIKRKLEVKKNTENKKKCCTIVGNKETESIKGKISKDGPKTKEKEKPKIDQISTDCVTVINNDQISINEKQQNNNEIEMKDTENVIESQSLNSSNTSDSLHNFSFSKELEKLNIQLNMFDTNLKTNEILTESNLEKNEQEHNEKDKNSVLETENVGLKEIPIKRLECKTLFMQEMIIEDCAINSQKSLIKLNADNNLKIVLNKNTDKRNVIIDTTINVIDKFSPNCDSDSNYSFSELKTEINDTIDTIIPNKDTNSTTQLPDYISINANDLSNENITFPTVNAQEVVCKAKIFLSKEDSQILLSPAGNTRLMALIPKYNLIVQMEWHSTGNILCLTGIPSEQGKFQSELLEFIVSLSKIERQKKLDINLPKSRRLLVNYIKRLLSLLDKDFGNVNILYHKINYKEQFRSKCSQKFVDKARTMLNIVLFGQNGLGDGKMHLNEIKNCLQSLENDMRIIIPFEYRTEIYQHIRYIFTPFEHDNYDQFVNEYNILNAVTVNSATFIPEHNIIRTIENDVTVTKENNENIEDIEDQIENQITINTINPSSSTAPMITTEIQISTATLPVTQSSNSTTASLASPAIIAPISVEQIPSTSSTIIPLPITKQDSKPSVFWSEQCEILITKCKQMLDPTKNPTTNSKLDQVSIKAKNNGLTKGDYDILTKIIEKLENKAG